MSKENGNGFLFDRVVEGCDGTPDFKFEGHVVRTYWYGDSPVYVCDDYCVKTHEEVQRILDRCEEIILASRRRRLREAIEKKDYATIFDLTGKNREECEAMGI